MTEMAELQVNILQSKMIAFILHLPFLTLSSKTSSSVRKDC